MRQVWRKCPISICGSQVFLLKLFQPTANIEVILEYKSSIMSVTTQVTPIALAATVEQKLDLTDSTDFVQSWLQIDPFVFMETIALIVSSMPFK